MPSVVHTCGKQTGASSGSGSEGQQAETVWLAGAEGCVLPPTGCQLGALQWRLLSAWLIALPARHAGTTSNHHSAPAVRTPTTTLPLLRTYVPPYPAP